MAFCIQQTISLVRQGTVGRSCLLVGIKENLGVIIALVLLTSKLCFGPTLSLRVKDLGSGPTLHTAATSWNSNLKKKRKEKNSGSRTTLHIVIMTTSSRSTFCYAVNLNDFCFVLLTAMPSLRRDYDYINTRYCHKVVEYIHDQELHG